LQETPAALVTGSSGPRSAAMITAEKDMLADALYIFKIQAGEGG
jgi:hypothetical protein